MRKRLVTKVMNQPCSHENQRIWKHYWSVETKRGACLRPYIAFSYLQTWSRKSGWMKLGGCFMYTRSRSWLWRKRFMALSCQIDHREEIVRVSITWMICSFDHRTKCFVIIYLISLFISLSHQPSFNTFIRYVRIIFNLNHPFTSYQVHQRLKWNSSQVRLVNNALYSSIITNFQRVSQATLEAQEGISRVWLTFRTRRGWKTPDLACVYMG